MLIVNEAMPHGRIFDEDHFISPVFPWLVKEKRLFMRRNSATSFSIHMDNSACHDGIRLEINWYVVSSGTPCIHLTRQTCINATSGCEDS
jgi:hypothetical protein